MRLAAAEGGPRLVVRPCKKQDLDLHAEDMHIECAVHRRTVDFGAHPDMKSLTVILCAFLLVTIAASSYCAEGPSSKPLVSEGDPDAKSKCADCTTAHEIGWTNVISDPVAVFTFFLAVFTMLLFWESASSNKRRLRAYVLPDNISL